MVQGGIQGDEISGFLTAQVLAGSLVQKGNLIVVPRANVPSILKRQRKINVDLNRRFDQDYNKVYEDRLARVIRFLLQKSNAFIHLHEGSGFYSPTYVNNLRNPNRYGQSVIIDTLVYEDRIFLADAVNYVLPKVNGNIVPAHYRFRLFNTQTFAKDTAYGEQRKSLTFYAIKEQEIPALAIEVSKNIKHISWKVRQQLKATEHFLNYFGVRIKTPDLKNLSLYPPAEKDQIELWANSQKLESTKAVTLPLKRKLQLDLQKQVSEKLSSADWGVFASDRPGINLLQTERLPLKPFEYLSVIADGKLINRFRIDWEENLTLPEACKRPLFVCRLNESWHFLAAGDELEAVQGDRFLAEGIWDGKNNEVVNIKGYVSQPGKNDGQDKGHELVLDPGIFIDRYLLSDSGKGTWRFEAVRETPGVKRKRITVRVVPRKLESLTLSSKACPEMLLPIFKGKTYQLKQGSYELKDLASNGAKEQVLVIANGWPLNWGESITVPAGEKVSLKFLQSTTFKPLARIYLQGVSN